MNQQPSVNANGVHVAGNFQAAAGYASDWNPGITQLTDADMDGIYEITVQIPAGSYQYKYINGNAWGQDESAPSTCAVGGTNRGVTINGDTVLTAFCYAQCSPCSNNNYNVTFRVDMNQQSSVSPLGVHIAGDFQAAAGQGNNWNPAGTQLSDPDMDGIYEVTVQLPGGTYAYKYINGNAWGQDEGVPSACSVNNNRELVLGSDTTLTAYCFGACNSCSAPTYFVQFRVDMSTECNWDSVDVAGDFNSWSGGDFLSASGAQGVYAITKQLQAGTYSFKFRKFYNGSVVWESIGNRSLTVANHTSYPINCFNSDTTCGTAVSAADVTFRVNMTGQTIDAAGVYLVGDFTSPAWQSGAIQMTQSGNDPNIYETTVSQLCPTELRYKYVNGDVNSAANEELLDSADIACSEDNGLGGYNRYHMRSGSNESVYAYWESCDTTAPAPPGCSNIIDSVEVVNLSQGVHRIHLVNLPAGASDYAIEWKEDTASTWKSKSFSNPNQASVKINITPRFNTNVELRVTSTIGGNPQYSCVETVAVPCKPMVIQMAEQNSAFCAGDSALVRVGYAGGQGTKNILWSNGATTKRTYAQQGETLYATVSDSRGCSVTDTITATTLNTSTAPSNFSTSRSVAMITGTWDAATMGAGQTLIGYRMSFRLRNSGNSWTNTTLTTDTFQTIDWTGSGIPAGNYEFVVFARYNDNGSNTNSNFSCRYVQGYNGVGGKTDITGLSNESSPIVVYPNPANDQINVLGLNGSHVQLMDLNGRVLGTQIIEDSEITFDISELATGAYMIHVVNGERVHTEKVIVE